jgi:hypothetical protein
MLKSHALRAATPKGLTLSFDRVLAATQNTITLPTNLPQNGLLVWRTGGSGEPSSITRSGWTQIDQFRTLDVGTTVARQYFYKSISSSDNGATLNGIQANQFGATNYLVVFSANQAITSTSLHSVAGQYTNGTPTNQTITSGSGTRPFVAVAAYSSSGAFTAGAPASMTLLTDNTPSLVWAYQIFNAQNTPVNLTVSKTDSGNRNDLVGCYIQVA